MYQPPHFQEERIEVMHELIIAHPFATLVSLEGSGLSANHIPLVLHPKLSKKATLRGHIAKANPLWKNYDATIDVLAIFQGAQHYITPSWYPSKKEHGKVVPTWNYVIVHASGPLKIIEDDTWLREHLNELTSRHEGERPVPWNVADAPADYVERQLKGIVGLEIPISHLEGKWKVSQNRSDQDRLGISRGLTSEGGNDSEDMSKLIEKYNG